MRLSQVVPGKWCMRQVIVGGELSGHEHLCTGSKETGEDPRRGWAVPLYSGPNPSSLHKHCEAEMASVRAYSGARIWKPGSPVNLDQYLHGASIHSIGPVRPAYIVYDQSVTGHRWPMRCFQCLLTALPTAGGIRPSYSTSRDPLLV